ncbi:MAG TPA: glycosyltransferase family 2 protein [Terriglobia bacterium]|nr:glycosyltransferase family 2 protein [Terriglobia bacterium]
MNTQPTSLPLVTVLMPIRNEEQYIAEAVTAVLNQTYPSDKIEILVVDGMSDDRTRQIINSLPSASSIRILDNPKRIVPAGLNIGIRAARGEIIARVDGHAVIEPSYVASVVSMLNGGNLACVGGPIETVNSTFTGKTIAEAMSSRFGVGNSAFRTSDFEGFVDTLAFPSYPAWVFASTGLFDEELVRCQDDEFNYRLRKLGGRIFLTSKIRSRYYARGHLSKLWKQYFQYGFWKVRVFQKHSSMMQTRHFIPTLFLLSLVSTLLGALLWKPMLLMTAAIAGFYLLISVVFSTAIAAKKDWRYVFVLPLVFAILHTSYGSGFLVGLVKFASRWRGGEFAAAAESTAGHRS